MLARHRWARGGDLRRAIGQIGLGVFLLGGIYMAYTQLSLYDLPVGEDADAYWAAGRDLTNLYEAYGGPERYLYSPVFAQLVSPLAQLPWPLFIVIWMVAETAAFAWLLRPLGWRWVVPLLFWLSPEIMLGNIVGFLGVALVLTVTRWPGASAAILLTKPPLGIGLLWFAVRRQWRALFVASVTTLVIVAVSFAWRPESWFEWVDFLLAMAAGEGATGAPGLWGRLLFACVLVAYAARADRAWLLPIALLAANPVLVSPSIAILAAIPRLRRARRPAQQRVSAEA